MPIEECSAQSVAFYFIQQAVCAGYLYTSFFLWKELLTPFHSQKWPRHTYNDKKTRDDCKEQYQLKDYHLIQW